MAISCSLQVRSLVIRAFFIICPLSLSLSFSLSFPHFRPIAYAEPGFFGLPHLRKGESTHINLVQSFVILAGPQVNRWNLTGFVDRIGRCACRCTQREYLGEPKLHEECGLDRFTQPIALLLAGSVPHGLQNHGLAFLGPENGTLCPDPL